MLFKIKYSDNREPLVQASIVHTIAYFKHLLSNQLRSIGLHLIHRYESIPIT